MALFGGEQGILVSKPVPIPGARGMFLIFTLFRYSCRTN